MAIPQTTPAAVTVKPIATDPTADEARSAISLLLFYHHIIVLIIINIKTAHRVAGVQAVEAAARAELLQVRHRDPALAAILRLLIEKRHISNMRETATARRYRRWWWWGQQQQQQQQG